MSRSIRFLWYLGLAVAPVAAVILAIMAYLKAPTSYWAALWPLIATGWQLIALATLDAWERL